MSKPHEKRLCVARRLRDNCIHKLVTEPQLLSRIQGELLPSNCFPLMMTEAIYFREAPAIEWLVSNWPMKIMRLFDHVPLEVGPIFHAICLLFDSCV